ncbi:MAG: hypothetical protein ACF8QF_10030 [Phycisphaerales bacterium]
MFGTLMRLRRPAATLALAGALLFAGAPRADAETFDQRLEAGARHRYTITNRFAPTLHQPTRGDSRTIVEATMEVTIAVLSADRGRMVLRVRVDKLDFEFLDFGSGAVIGLQFDDDDDPEMDMRNPGATLRSFVGQVFEVLVDGKISSVQLRDIVWPLLPEDNAGNIMKRLIGEGLLAHSLSWIVGLPPVDADLAPGDAFSDEVLVRFPGDGEVAFLPAFLFDGVEDDRAAFTIGGEVAYTDNRSPLAMVTGRQPMTIDASTLSGAAVWRTDLGALESLELTASATLEPDPLDPLGRRIERKSIEESFIIRRIEPAEAGAE